VGGGGGVQAREEGGGSFPLKVSSLIGGEPRRTCQEGREKRETKKKSFAKISYPAGRRRPEQGKRKKIRGRSRGSEPTCLLQKTYFRSAGKENLSRTGWKRRGGKEELPSSLPEKRRHNTLSAQWLSSGKKLKPLKRKRSSGRKGDRIHDRPIRGGGAGRGKVGERKGGRKILFRHLQSLGPAVKAGEEGRGARAPAAGKGRILFFHC